MTLLRAVACAGLLVQVACSAAVPAPPRAASQSDWDGARNKLESARARAGAQPYVDRVRVAFRAPGTATIGGRGAVAVSPGAAMRLIVVGPAGVTALDLWVTPNRWRLSIPAIGLLQRGEQSAPASMPVGFFRAWLVRPFIGRLLTIVGDELVLAEGGAIERISGAIEEGRGRMVRREGTSIEQIEMLAPSGADGAEGRVRYRALSTGLEVDVWVEGRSTAPPDVAAFADPDLPEGSP